MLTIAILAGGLGTRLGGDQPKCLVPVQGRPFAKHQIGLLKAAGYRRVVWCVGHGGDLVQAALGDGSDQGMEFVYAFDGATPLGTGGALAQALPVLSDAFAVLYGDSYLPCDYGAIERAFLASGKPAQMTVARPRGYDAGNCLIGGGRVLCYGKDAVRMIYILKHLDYGLLHFKAEVFTGRERGDLSAILQRLAEDGQLAAHEVRAPYWEIGTPESLAAFRAMMEGGQ